MWHLVFELNWMKLKISNQKTGVSFDPYKHSMIMQILHIYFNNITLELFALEILVP